MRLRVARFLGLVPDAGFGRRFVGAALLLGVPIFLLDFVRMLRLGVPSFRDLVIFCLILAPGTLVGAACAALMEGALFRSLSRRAAEQDT